MIRGSGFGARCSMGRIAPFGLLLPVFALISSVLFLGDRMTPKLIVGGLLTISGVATTQVRPSARPILTSKSCRGDFRVWHIASFRCGAKIWLPPEHDQPAPIMLDL
jgi:EamA-like transporter family